MAKFRTSDIVITRKESFETLTVRVMGSGSVSCGYSSFEGVVIKSTNITMFPIGNTSDTWVTNAFILLKSHNIYDELKCMFAETEYDT